MKMTYFIITTLIITMIIMYFTGRDTHKRNVEYAKQMKMIEEKKIHIADIYHDLRNMALNCKAEDIGIVVPVDKTTVYGVVMDWSTSEGIATLVTFLNGNASLYLSSGGGNIGCGGYKSVRDAAIAFTQDMDNYIGMAEEAKATPLPVTNSVNYFLLTNKGKYVLQDNLNRLYDNSSVYMGLFEKANDVITEISKVTEIK